MQAKSLKKNFGLPADIGRMGRLDGSTAAANRGVRAKEGTPRC